MKRFFSILLFSLLLLPQFASALEWEQGYDMYLFDIATDPAGNVLAMGQNGNIGTTIKYDTNGNQLWAANYVAGNSINFNALEVDSSGNVYVVGYIVRSPNDDLLVIKYDSSGNQVWAREYDGGAYEYGYAVAVDNLGNVYAGGQSYLSSSSKYLTIKFDSNGNEIWNRLHDVVGSSDRARTLAVDADYNVYVAGTAMQTGYGIWLETIKYDSTGALLWSKMENNDYSNDIPKKIRLDSVGNVIVAGTRSWNTGTTSAAKYYIHKYDSSGNTLWSHMARCDINHSLANIDLDSNDNVFMAGSCGRNNDYAYHTFKFDSGGAIVWTSIYDPRNSAVAADVAVSPAGTIHVTGTSNGNIHTVAYDSSGTEMSVDTYSNGGNNDTAKAISVDQAGSVFIGGQSQKKSDSSGIVLKY